MKNDRFIVTIGALVLSALLGAVSFLLPQTLWKAIGADCLIGTLVVKLPPTTQPTALLVIRRRVAFAAILGGVSWLASGWISWIAAGVAILLMLWILGFIFHRYRTAWRRIYFGVMDYHGAIVGAHVAAEHLTQGRMELDPLKQSSSITCCEDCTRQFRRPTLDTCAFMTFGTPLLLA